MATYLNCSLAYSHTHCTHPMHTFTHSLTHSHSLSPFSVPLPLPLPLPLSPSHSLSLSLSLTPSLPLSLSLFNSPHSLSPSLPPPPPLSLSRHKFQAKLKEAEEALEALQTKYSALEKTKTRIATELEDLNLDVEKVHHLTQDQFSKRYIMFCTENIS